MDQSMDQLYDVGQIDGITLHKKEWNNSSVVLQDYKQVEGARRRSETLGHKEEVQEAQKVLDRMQSYFPDLPDRLAKEQRRREREGHLIELFRGRK